MTEAMRRALMSGSTLSSAMGVTWTPDEPVVDDADNNSHIAKFESTSDDDDSDGEDDLADILKSFAEDEPDPEGDDDSTDDDDDDDDTTAQSEALNKEIGDLIKGYSIPDDAIPDDFDAADPKQLKALLNRTSQSAIAHAMAVTIRPVQAAMTHLERTLTRQMDDRIKSSSTELRDSSIFNDLIPEAEDPKYKGVVSSLHKSLKESKPKMSVRERATTIRKLLNQMGIKGSKRPTNKRGQQDSDDSTSIRTGSAALDSFFGKMPTPKPAAKK